MLKDRSKEGSERAEAEHPSGVNTYANRVSACGPMRARSLSFVEASVVPLIYRAIAIVHLVIVLILIAYLPWSLEPSCGFSRYVRALA